MNNIPKILILQSVYNGEKYLAAQLGSIVAQEGVNVSLYIRDDGSEDNSHEIIQEYAKKMPIIYCRESNIGAARSFLRLIELATDEYDYYAFADQDDYWDKDKLYTAIQYLQDISGKPALYYSNTRRVGQDLEEIADPYKKVYHTEKFPDILIMTEAPGCTMVFNQQLFRLLKKYIPTRVYMHDQWALQVCAAVGGTVIYDAQPHMLYRQHENNVMAGLDKMKCNPVELFLYRVRKFFDFSYKPSLIAAELKEGYFELMDREDRKIIQTFIDAPEKIKYRVNILLMNKIGTPYWIYNVKFKLQVLLNKI